MNEVRFYAVSSARYFPGVVGLLNSLRITGHQHQLVVGSVGLTAQQKAALTEHCRVEEIPVGAKSNPLLYKPFPYLLNPDGIVIVLDADIIVTSSLKRIFKQAEEGKICVFPDPGGDDRWFVEWESLLQLSSSLRHQRYINSGFVAFSTAHWPNLLHRWWSACQLIPPSRTFGYNDLNDDPLLWGDQDALNAILMSEFPEDALAIFPMEEGPTSSAMRKAGEVIDTQSLACTYQGHRVMLFQSTSSPKPWEFTGWKRVWKNPYVILLSRVLSGTDVALKIPKMDLPIWLRSGRRSNLVLDILGFFNSTRHSLFYGTIAHKYRKWRRQLKSKIRYSVETLSGRFHFIK